MLVLQVTYDLLNQILLLFHKLANYTPQLKSWIEVTWGLFPRIKPTSKYMTVQNPDKMRFDWHQQNPEWPGSIINLKLFINLYQSSSVDHSFTLNKQWFSKEKKQQMKHLKDKRENSIVEESVLA